MEHAFRGLRSPGTCLPDEDRQLLTSYVNRVGERAAQVALGVSRPTLARALAGLGIRGVTLALLRDRLAALATAKTEAE